jgi:hypothetical protein
MTGIALSLSGLPKKKEKKREKQNSVHPDDGFCDVCASATTVNPRTNKQLRPSILPVTFLTDTKSRRYYNSRREYRNSSCFREMEGGNTQQTMKIMVFQLFLLFSSLLQCSPIMEVNDTHSWHHDSRVTDDSDCESENDLRY